MRMTGRMTLVRRTATDRFTMLGNRKCFMLYKMKVGPREKIKCLKENMLIKTHSVPEALTFTSLYVLLN